MNFLIHLISRILAGERFEKASRRETAFWLSILALLPAQIILLFFICLWVEKFFGYGMDSYLNVFLFILLMALIMWASTTVALRIFSTSPFRLIPVGLASWGAAVWLVFHH